MKAALSALAVLLMLPAIAVAQAPPTGYLGIYADEDRGSWCAEGTPPYQFEAWVYLLIGAEGAEAFSFDLEVPSNVQALTMDLNRSEGNTICLPPYCDQGLAGTFSFCLQPPRTTLIWVVQMTIEVLDAAPSVMRIVENHVSHSIYVQRCDHSYENPIILTELYINHPASSPECSVMATESSTWGAIKSLCR